MVLAAEINPLPVARAIRAAADVIEVDDDDDGQFRASVYSIPGRPAVARLARSLRGAHDEGEVLREVMLTTSGARGPGYFVWRREPSCRR